MPRISVTKWIPNAASPVTVKCFPYYGNDGKAHKAASAKTKAKSVYAQTGAWNYGLYRTSYILEQAINRLLTRKAGPKNGV